MAFPDQLPDTTTPLLRTTPEIELLEPPTNKLPPIPTPPAIVKAPVEEDKELSEEDAWEFLEFNTFCAYVGEQTPLYVNTY